jgi:hypothetical protein
MQVSRVPRSAMGAKLLFLTHVIRAIAVYGCVASG